MHDGEAIAAAASSEADDGRRPAGAEAEAPLIVYFDGTCSLCTLEIEHYAARSADRRLAFFDVSGRNPDTGTDLAAEEAMRRFHVRLPGGNLVSDAEAFVSIWRRPDGWRWAAKVARLPGVMPALELGYRLFLPLRPKLARLAARLGARPVREVGGGAA